MASQSKRKANESVTETSLILNTKRTLRPAKISKTDKKIEVIKDEPIPSTDHYIIHELKNDGDEHEISFVLTDNNSVLKNDDRKPPAECREEIQIEERLQDNEEADEGDDEDVKTQEIVEHVCGKCYKSFRTIKVLKRHLEYCIFNCDMVVRKAEMLKNIEKIEKEAFIMEKKDICFCCGDSYDTCHLGHINCSECPKTFKTQLSLERHMFLIHAEITDFPCTVCNGRIRTAELLKLHTEQHKTRGKPYACKSCGKDFTRLYHLKRHNKFTGCGSGQADVVICNVCGKEFFRLDNLRVHLKSHLGQGTPKKPEYMCPCCKRCFYSLSTLNIHIRTHTGERPFDCDLCDKNFPSLVSLKKHRRYHTGEKPYTCSVCHQNFAVKEVLNRHMKRHTGHKPHVCEHCDKRFIQATQLRNHLRTHLRPFECTQCPEKFRTQKQLEKHVKVHSARGSRKRYYCKDCDVHFLSSAIKAKHETTTRHKQNAEKPCPSCDKIFPDEKQLQFHILRDHEKVCTKCDKCQEEFESVHVLKQHMAAVHEPKRTFTVEEVKEEDAIVIEEFIVDSLEAVPSETEKTDFTVIAKENEVTPEFEKSKKIMKGDLRAELKKSLASCLKDDSPTKKPPTNPMSEEDKQITENVSKLLDMLVDVETLVKFGWPDDSVENVLCKVIENCGYNLHKTKYSEDYGQRMREFVKLLFTVVIQNDSIKELLNNYPIDEVIEFVLSNEDDE